VPRRQKQSFADSREHYTCMPGFTGVLILRTRVGNSQSPNNDWFQFLTHLRLNRAPDEKDEGPDRGPGNNREKNDADSSAVLGRLTRPTTKERAPHAHEPGNHFCNHEGDREGRPDAVAITEGLDESSEETAGDGESDPRPQR
jgi:hypothetical protein